MKRFVLEMTACAALATGLAWAQTARSRVEMWLVNPQGAVDGMLLADGRAFYFVPEIARNLTLTVHLHDPVRLETQAGHRWIVDDRDGSRLELTGGTEARGGGPVSTASLQPITARGHVTAFLRQPEGSVSGFVLSTGEQVRVPASLSGRLNGVQLGDLLTVRGLGTRGTFGTGIAPLSIETDRGVALLSR